MCIEMEFLDYLIAQERLNDKDDKVISSEEIGELLSLED
jgi:hypothetical protein